MALVNHAKAIAGLSELKQCDFVCAEELRSDGAADKGRKFL